MASSKVYADNWYYINKKSHQERMEDGRLAQVYTEEQMFGIKGWMKFWFIYLTQFWRFKKHIGINLISEK